MGFYIFDLDGTLVNVDHRRPLLPDWNAFFEACDKDPAIDEVHAIFQKLFYEVGPTRYGKPSTERVNRVEIWSGRSAQVEEKTRVRLAELGINPAALTRMRPIDNYEPDDVLKKRWLHEEIAAGNTPDVIFDDRIKVVEMWRKEGMTCFQVNAGDFDSPTMVKPNPVFSSDGLPLLTLLIGPSGAGKSTIAEAHFDAQAVVSSDRVRKLLCGDPGDQSRNKDVWVAVAELVKTRMRVGLPTVVDATNVKRRDRLAIAELCPPDQTCAYILVERPLNEMLTTAGARLDLVNAKGENVVQRHARVMEGNRKDIMKGDGLPNVRVFANIVAYLTYSGLVESAWKKAREDAAQAVSDGAEG